MNVEATIREVRGLTEKYNKLLSKSKSLITNMDGHVQHVTEHLSEIKKLLGLESVTCSICCKDKITHCVDECRHCFCETCARRCMRGRCMVCRANVTAIYKIFL